MKLDEAAVPCDLQFDPLSKAYLLLLCSNGALALYGISGEGNSLDLVSSRRRAWDPALCCDRQLAANLSGSCRAKGCTLCLEG